MWTERFRIRPVSHCKEGCRIQPAGIPGGRTLNAGVRLAQINNLADIASPLVLGSFVLSGLSVLVPALLAKINAKRSSRASEQPDYQGA